ncbi:MAG: T9SS type A sorting domain-containing protein [Bacteroidota bacterium]
MRLASLLSLLLFAGSALAQDATQDVRLRLVSNDATAGGTLTIAVEARTSAARAPNTSLGSGTIDIAYDEGHLTPTGFTNPGTPGYSFTVNVIDCNGITGSKCVRFGITSTGIGTGFGSNPGFEISSGTAYTELAQIGFTLDATSAADLSLVIDRLTLSVGYYDSEDNGSGNGVIEDNTGTVGDDVVAVATIGDLSVRTASFGSENWHLRGVPGTGATLDALVGPLWTQGYPGSDAGTNGAANVIFWNESTGGYLAPGNQTDGLTPGVGAFIYAYADDDFDGNADPFPKTALVTVEPVNNLGAPVNDVTPDPYTPELPFTFPTTFTSGSGVAQGDGWNLLANPADSTADWDASGWTRTNVSESFATWDAENAGGAQYVSWTAAGGGSGTRGNGLLAPFEGFWNQALAASPVLVMPEAAYGAPASVTREAGAAPAVRLHVAGAVGGQDLATETLVVFVDGADAGRDRFDAPELTGLTSTRLQLFTMTAEGDPLDIDVRGSLDDGPSEIDLDLEAVADDAWAAADLVLTWPELRALPEAAPVQLLDTETGTIVDLRTASEYAFSVAVPAEARRAAPTPGVQLPEVPRPNVVGSQAEDNARLAGAGARFVLFVGTEARAVSNETPDAPVAFALAPPSPNPVVDRVTLRYGLDAAGPARVALYDMLGREVALAADGDHAAGSHEAAVSANTLAAGVYVVRLDAGGRSLTRTLTVVR